MGDVSNFLNDTNPAPDTTVPISKLVLPKNRLVIVQHTPDETTFECMECSASYSEKEEMELHLLTHNKEYRFLCGLCGAGLKRKEHLERHTLGHQEVRPHVCDECGKGFKRKEHLNIHRTIHTGERSQVCPLCQRSFHRKDHLQKHLLTHNKQFMDALSDQGLTDLKQEIMDEDIKPEIYHQEDGLNDLNHSTPGIATAERPFACQYCDKTYKRKDHLKMHSVKHMAKDKTCSECGKAFRTEEQLLFHMNTHLQLDGLAESASEDPTDLIPVDHTQIDITPMTELLVPRAERRPHECAVCHKRFKRRQHLKVHANVHAKEVQSQPTVCVWCSLCSVGFSSNEQFESHECVSDSPASQSEQSGEPHDGAKKENQPQYTQPEFVDFSAAENTSYHESPPTVSRVEERLIPRPQRVYVCKYCAKPFRRKDHYKIHLHIHTGVKSFFCVDCGKGFYRKDHLQKHALVHLKARAAPRARRDPPPLFPINMLKKKLDDIKPEITITAPSNMKVRVPLQMKVPYQMVRVDTEPHHANE